ncbi:MAG: glycosyltransferase family 4 protein, partial [Fimbriimonadales bacterium]
MEARVFQHAEGVITISPADYEYYVRRFPELKEKIHFVPLGIELDEYQPQTRNEDGIVRVLFVGRLDASKGLDLLVAGFAKFHARHPNSQLILVGGSQDFSPVEAEVKQWIAEHRLGEAVVMTGLLPRQAILPYYHQADVFVLTSHWEGLPTALLEALACGVPAVVTNVGGMPSVVQDDYNGYVLKERDPDQLAHLIERALQNRLQLSQNARQTAERYSIQAHAQTVWQWMKMTSYSEARAQELVC